MHADHPNFIFILADDLGYADLGCYGARADTSPQLDRMAGQGLRMTRAYANSPVCSPTRFALMTGRYQYRLRGAAEEPLHGSRAANAALGLPPAHPTLPSLLREAGYATALVGKWHLGLPPHCGPRLSGYQEHFGLLGGGVDYFTHTAPNGALDLWQDGEPAQVAGYLTDLLSARAEDFVRRCRSADRPFLLSLHYTAPHWPWETRQDEALAQTLVGRIFHLDGGSVDTYRRMIHHMDEGIGRLLATLDETGAAENTLVVFTSDNGGERFSDSWPLIGGKMDLTEGGIRVPCLVRWPAQVPAAAVTDAPTITMDWVATMLEAAGVAAAPAYPLDGRSLLPLLRAPAAPTAERALYWRMKHRDQLAMREGRWKYLRVDGHEYLFDIDADERERANLREREPQRFAQMRERCLRWNDSMPPIPADATVTLPYGKRDMP